MVDRIFFRTVGIGQSKRWLFPRDALGQSKRFIVPRQQALSSCFVVFVLCFCVFAVVVVRDLITEQNTNRQAKERNKTNAHLCTSIGS